MVFWSACIGRNHLCCGNPDFIDALYKRKQYIFETGLNLESAASFSKKGMEVYGFSIFGQYIPMQGNGGSTETPLNYFFPGQFLYFHFAAVWSDHVRDDSHFVGDHRIESKKKKKDWVLFVDSCDHCISEYYGTAFAGYFI